MMQEPDHDSIRADLPGEVLGGLAPADHERVRAHLEKCAPCREELAQLTNTVAMLLLRAPLRTMNETRSRAIRARLVERAAAEPPRGATPHPSASRLASALRHPVTGWAVAAGLASLLLTHHGFHRPVDFGWVAAGALLAALLATLAYTARLRAKTKTPRRRHDVPEVPEERYTSEV